MRLEKKTQIKKIREKWGRRREILVCILKKKSSRVCGFPPTLSASLTSTAQAVLILQTQELIFSFLSIFVLLDFYLPLACILLLILNWPSWPSISTHFLSLPDLKNASTPTPIPQIECLKFPSVLAFTILLKYPSFPYQFPHNIGALLFLPHILSWNSHLHKVGTVAFGQEIVLNTVLKTVLKCYYKKQTWDAREGVESPNILWILRVCEVSKEGGRKDRRRKKKRKEIQKNENAGKEERERSGLLKFNSLPQWQFTRRAQLLVIVYLSVPTLADHSTSCKSFLLASRTLLVPTCLTDCRAGHQGLFWLTS